MAAVVQARKRKREEINAAKQLLQGSASASASASASPATQSADAPVPKSVGRPVKSAGMAHKARAARWAGARPAAKASLPLPPGFQLRDSGWADPRTITISPNKGRYRGAKAVDARIRAQTLRSGVWHRGEEMLDEQLGELRETATVRKGRSALGTVAGRTPHALVTIDAAQLDEFAATMALRAHECGRRGCEGAWAAFTNESQGLGGSINVHYRCNGTCGQPTVSFRGSEADLVHKTRSQVGLSIVVSFIVAGDHFSEYARFATAAGMDAPYTAERFNQVLQLMLPHTAIVLQEDIDVALAMMKEMGLDQALVCTDDGRWGTTGFHSKNCTFGIALQDLLGALIGYGHACMRAGDDTDVEGCPNTFLWEGTAKAAEGFLCLEAYGVLKDLGFNVAKIWKDRDASGDVRTLFADYVRRLCFGHGNRAWAKRLLQLISRKYPDCKLRPELAGTVRMRRSPRGGTAVCCRVRARSVLC